MPPQAHPQPPAQQQQHDAQFEFLQAAFVEYAGALRETCGESNRSRLLNLTAQLQAKGVHGSHALQLIQQYSAQINWQGMTPEVFNSFYRFVYFICREPSKRNVQVATAVAAWRMVLRGRFRLLDRWCAYVGTHHKASVVLEDTWRQVLDFSRTVHEDLSNYDPASAWPVLLDDFVEHLKGGRRPGSRPPPLAVEAADLLAPWAGRGMTAMSPRSGSKRRPPDVMEVADQLQQLPLLSTCEQPAPAGAAPGDGDAVSGSTPQRQLLPKRLRVGMMAPPPPQQQQQLQGGASPGGDAVMHSRRLAGGVNLFAAAFGTLDGSMQGPYHHHQQQQQQAESGDGCSLNFTPGAYSTAVHGSSSSRVVAAGGAAGPAYHALPTGLVLREAGQGLQQQHQQHGLIMQQQQQMDVALFPDACGSQDMMDVAPEQHVLQCQGLDQHQQGLDQQQQQLLRQRSATPPAVSPAAGHLLSHDAEGMRRISPLMHVTVTDALGLH